VGRLTERIATARQIAARVPGHAGLLSSWIEAVAARFGSG